MHERVIATENRPEMTGNKYRSARRGCDGFVCEECGKMLVMQYGRIKGDKKACIDYAS